MRASVSEPTPSRSAGSRASHTRQTNTSTYTHQYYSRDPSNKAHGKSGEIQVQASDKKKWKGPVEDKACRCCGFELGALSNMPELSQDLLNMNDS